MATVNQNRVNGSPSHPQAHGITTTRHSGEILAEHAIDPSEDYQPKN